MLKIFYCKGAPGSGKSTWAKQEIAKDPLSYLRVNNDDLRNSFNSSAYSPDYEKLIRDTRNYLIREGIKRNLNIVIDNVNASNRHWEDVVKIAKESNKDIQMVEKVFYEDLEVLLERNAKREGTARVPDEVVKKFFKELGGAQHRFYHPRVEIFTHNNKGHNDRVVEPMVQDERKPHAIISDLDGTLAKIGDRSPYSAADCDIIDSKNPHVVDIINLYYNSGHKIIFCSGRMETDRAPTIRFIEKHLPGVEYELFLRKDNDFRKDRIIKEEIFNEHIKDKYFVKAVFDDRLQVCQLWYEMGLNLFRVGDPDANF